MKTKLFKIGSLLYYSYMTNKELSNNALWIFTEDFKERANKYLEQYGIYNHYENLDLRLYISNSKPSPFEARILRSVRDFESKVLCLGLIDYIKRRNPDITNVNRLISILNKPERIILAGTRAMILNEFCTVEA